MCGRMFSFFLARFQGVGLPGLTVSLCFIFQKLTNCSPKCPHQFTFPPVLYEGFLHVLREHVVSSVFVILAIVVHVTNDE